MNSASDKSNERLVIEVDTDREGLASCLDLYDVRYFQPKGDVATIVVALGGGVGIAAIVRSVAVAIEHYFRGRAKLAEAEAKRAKAESPKLRVKVSRKSIEVTSTNAGEIESEILSELGINQ